ncbi:MULTISPECIES: fumarylacetoacetate hydrolase family protein [unclassified Ruegeria]|uniref:fumarylacetoacetate hydrolase family protein n=1 Tax=unclassified Ruegeria TaxID=2625375 RepID=UPI0014883071|nr:MULTISPECIES: fumarylacetoacetate hydrolase family protein [unclassified Ruegeria]NOD33267.1 FAA hydrolase family protein [Ruegeria sp. HKCCD7296]NOD48672.1 FAA hydrolase family protein [Ruegeria sp. HKCCD5849]NOD52026.1 FAA hydrolase family protein [Ruegeria sp. HKCCD5851]NOD66684.1 FAA hydrolase family protein [Ruegeria sp. HKCCD7303]NOE33834.1 FAA hydrolase family protein [Ruegeria sp. HKCCD7318]
MSNSLFSLPDPVTIPVVGASAEYPVGRIFCVGRNYAAHAAEMGNEVDREAPFYFTKSAANAVLSGAMVPYPAGTENYHHEMELVLAIGKPVFRATSAQAWDAVYAYGCALDMTRRDLQIRERNKQRPWDLGKDVENGAVFAPLTPAGKWSPDADKHIRLRVNDELRQDATLEELIWKIDEIICHLSGFYHLRPGDLILTGTPAGVGPVVAGDVLSGEIDGLAPIELTLTDAK